MNRVIPHDAILIPNHAERAFKGVIFDVYQWSQDMFDGSTATFEMLKRPDTVICLAIKDDTIIFIREQQPGRPEHICLPGGRVDAGETWQAAMERECAEEIGLKFKNWRLIDVRQPVAKMEWFVALYLAERAVNHESGEKITSIPMTFEEAKKYATTAASPLDDHLRELFESVQSLAELQSLPEFQGKAVE